MPLSSFSSQVTRYISCVWISYKRNILYFRGKVTNNRVILKMFLLQILGDSQNVNLWNIYIAVSQMNDPNYWGENDFMKSEIDPKLPTRGSPPPLTADCFSRWKRMISSTSLTCLGMELYQGLWLWIKPYIRSTVALKKIYFSWEEKYTALPKFRYSAVNPLYKKYAPH